MSTPLTATRTPDELLPGTSGEVHALHAVVHLADSVAKDAQLQNFGQKLVALQLGVALLGAQQHQQPGAYCANHVAFNYNPRLADALQNSDHGRHSCGWRMRMSNPLYR